MSDSPSVLQVHQTAQQSSDTTRLLGQYNRLMYHYMSDPRFESMPFSTVELYNSSQMEAYANILLSYYSKGQTEKKEKTIGEYITSKIEGLEEIPTNNDNLMYQRGSFLLIIFGGKVESRYYRISLAKNQSILTNSSKKFVGSSVAEFLRWM